MFTCCFLISLDLFVICCYKNEVKDVDSSGNSRLPVVLYLNDITGATWWRSCPGLFQIHVYTMGGSGEASIFIHVNFADPHGAAESEP